MSVDTTELSIADAIGGPRRGSGPPQGISVLGKIVIRQFPGRVWGEIGTPKGLQGTIENNPLAKNPGKPHGDPIPPQNHVFRAPILNPKRGPRPSGTQTLTWGSKNEVRGQRYKSCGLKNHAESTSQCPKRSHMLQVMAPNHVRGGAPNLGWKIGSNLGGKLVQI